MKFEPFTEELRRVESRALTVSEEFGAALRAVAAIESNANVLRLSHSGSFFGDHALTHYEGFEQPPRGFDVEWGHLGGYGGKHNSDWIVYPLDELVKFCYGGSSAEELESNNIELETKAYEVRDHTLDALALLQEEAKGSLTKVIEDASAKIGSAFERATAQDYAKRAFGSAPRITRDSSNISQGMRTPVHVAALAQIHFLRETAKALTFTANTIRRVLVATELAQPSTKPKSSGSSVFIGHGRSPLWRELQNYLEKELGLQVEEFNSEPVAGISTQARLDEMLGGAAIALLVMTAEDELSDGTKRARENVIHEAGLFQGHLGWTRAIVLLEDGCAEFSNLHGLNHIKFGKGSIKDSFVDVRRVLAREGLVSR